MRFSTIAAIFTSVAVASASLIARQGPPACTTDCIANTDTGSCGTDNACLCRDNDFIARQAACFAKDCHGSDLDAANAFARQLCEFEGVTITSVPPVSTSGSSTPASSPTSGASSSPSATAPASSTGAPASTQSQTGNGASTLATGKSVAFIVAVVAGAFAL